MKDIQNTTSQVPIDINKVGVKDLLRPLIVRDQKQGKQHTVARMDLSVDLPAQFKGTHMSRFLEALDAWEGELDYYSFRNLLEDIKIRLQATESHICFKFPYFVTLNTPVSHLPTLINYDCFFRGTLNRNNFLMELGVGVPVMTVCPCSLAISDTGAHSQRAIINISATFSGLLWLEDLIKIATTSGSAPIYPLLKREDEKYITEMSFSNPMFVEDVVRKTSQKLDQHPLINSYKVEVESQESIHNHNAYACIEG